MRLPYVLRFMQQKLLILKIFKTGTRPISTSYGLILQSHNQLKGDSKVDDDFRVLELIKKRVPRRRKMNRFEAYFKQPRENVQSVTQDWSSVWPGIRTFHPATVPLPVRMGYPNKGKPNPDKWGNTELMKIPNFLHLTPPAIERQCAAIKKFCTPWPKELKTEEAQNYHFPVIVTTSSYLHSSPSIRDPRSRIVTFRVSLESLELDWHACDKMLRLVGDRFDPETKILTLVADRCPLSSQNLEYCFYLLTVLYNESQKVEPWEHEKEELDFEKYNFETSKSKQALNCLRIMGVTVTEEAVENYNRATTEIHNEGEEENSINNYKNAVMKILNLA